MMGLTKKIDIEQQQTKIQNMISTLKFVMHHHHHHHVVPPAWISLTLSRHFSLSFIASGRSSGLHPVSSHSCCMYVLAGRPALARAYVGVRWSTSLMSSSLLLQQQLLNLMTENKFDYSTEIIAFSL